MSADLGHDSGHDTGHDMAASRAAADLERLRGELVEVRLAAGVTQTQLAARLDTTQSAIARLEAGTAAPRMDTLERWARALGRRLRVTLDAPATVVGDTTGPRIGLSVDAEPVYLDPTAAVQYDLPPVTAVVGLPGSGKAKLLRSMAAQLYGDGRPVVTVTGPDSADALLPWQVWQLIDAPAGTPKPVDVPLNWELSGRAATRTALWSFQERLSRALAELPARAVVLVEDTVMLALAAPRVLSPLLREARSRGIGVVLAARDARHLGDWGRSVSRWVLFAADSDDGARAALEASGLQISADRVAELRGLDRSVRGGPRMMLVRDFDGRCALVTLGGTTLV